MTSEGPVCDLSIVKVICSPLLPYLCWWSLTISSYPCLMWPAGRSRNKEPRFLEHFKTFTTFIGLNITEIIKPSYDGNEISFFFLCPSPSYIQLLCKTVVSHCSQPLFLCGCPNRFLWVVQRILVSKGTTTETMQEPGAGILPFLQQQVEPLFPREERTYYPHFPLPLLSINLQSLCLKNS